MAERDRRVGPWCGRGLVGSGPRNRASCHNMVTAAALTNSESSAPCTPIACQRAILSEHDMQQVRSPRPGFVRASPAMHTLPCDAASIAAAAALTGRPPVRAPRSLTAIAPDGVADGAVTTSAAGAAASAVADTPLVRWPSATTGTSRCRLLAPSSPPSPPSTAHAGQELAHDKAGLASATGLVAPVTAASPHGGAEEYRCSSTPGLSSYPRPSAANWMVDDASPLAARSISRMR
mmetsp:Transcript_52497/g.154943  ORF Transcript_52497/g.154943 Transcript_52497/m.154943 type:complete len:235 (+) Transcript_52497:859-1563(+)